MKSTHHPRRPDRLAELSTVAYNPNVRPAQYSELVWADRAWVEQALSLNDSNRRLSPAGVRVWTERFNRRRYTLTHQGFAFDHDGYMCDGQHRAKGFLASDCDGFWTMVTYNVDRDSFAVMDNGLIRQPGQLIQGANANVKAAAARLLMDFPRLSFPTNRVDPADVIDVYKALEDKIDAAADLAVPVYRATGINKSMLTALLTIPLETGFDSARIVDFCDRLKDGANLEPDDPRLALRNRWAVESKYLNGVGRLSALFLITRAWNAYVRGERIKRLQLPRGGDASGDDIPEVER